MESYLKMMEEIGTWATSESARGAIGLSALLRLS